jgi:hypothetical protein
MYMETKERCPNVIHNALKSGGGIAKAEREDLVLVQATMSDESRLGHVLLLDANLMIP